MSKDVPLSDAADTLAHYGVVGMKWGKRHNNTRNYTSRDKTRDVYQYGSRGANRIEEHVKGGRTIGKARSKEFRRQTGQAAAVVALGATALLGPGLLATKAASVQNSRNAAAGARAAAEMLAKHGLTNYKTLVL